MFLLYTLIFGSLLFASDTLSREWDQIEEDLTRFLDVSCGRESSWDVIPREDPNWSRPTFHLGNGDLIIAVNNARVYNSDQFYREIQSSSSTVLIIAVNRQTGRVMLVRTNLWPAGEVTRLGLYVKTYRQIGVMVRGAIAGSPAERFQLLKNYDFRSVSVLTKRI